MLITLGTKKGLGVEPGKRVTLIIFSLWLPPSFLAALLLAPCYQRPFASRTRATTSTRFNLKFFRVFSNNRHPEWLHLYIFFTKTIKEVKLSLSRKIIKPITLFTKIQLVVYYRCSVLIGRATTKLYVIAHYQRTAAASRTKTVVAESRLASHADVPRTGTRGELLRTSAWEAKSRFAS